MVLPWAMNTVASCAIWLCAGAVTGALVLPRVSNALLKRSYTRSREWWLEVLNSEEPSDSEACANVASPSDAYQELCDITAKKHCYSFESSAHNRAMCASLLGVLWVICASCNAPPLPFALLVFCCFAGACGVVCDLRARVVPLECCVAVGLAGVVFQLLVCGWQGVCVGICVALLVLGLCWLANRLYARRGVSAVGLGDVKFMAALSLLCGPGSLTGAMACYCAAAFVSLIGLLTRRLKLNSGIPMAPFLTIWIVVGAGVCLCK